MCYVFGFDLQAVFYKMEDDISNELEIFLGIKKGQTNDMDVNM